MTEEDKICDPARSISARIMTLIMFSPELPLDAFVAICKKAKMPKVQLKLLLKSLVLLRP
jgi:hypothetical protein